MNNHVYAHTEDNNFAVVQERALFELFQQLSDHQSGKVSILITVQINRSSSIHVND